MEDKKQIILNSGEKLFSDIRDKNFNAVGAFLSKHAKLITSQLEDRHDKTVQEMKLFVQRLPMMLESKGSLARHTAIAECIKEVTDSYDFLDSLQVVFFLLLLLIWFNTLLYFSRLNKNF